MPRNGLCRLPIAAATAALVSASASAPVTFAIDYEGVAHDMTVIPSPGQTPFGFALGGGRQLFVSEAAGGAANASSVTSWRIAREGDLRLVDPAVCRLLGGGYAGRSSCVRDEYRQRHHLRLSHQ